MGQLAEYATNHPLLVLGLIAALLGVVFYEVRQRTQGQTQVSANDAVRLINNGAVVIDVRPAAQYEKGHIVDARNIELSRIESDPAAAVKKPKNKPLLLVCDNGLGASKAAKLLRKAGYDGVFSLKSGLSAWRAENLPLVK